MKYLFITAIFFVSQPIFAVDENKTQNLNESDFRLDGFREFKWGDSLAQYENNFELFQKGEGFALYKEKNEDLSIGDAKLTSLIYSFRNGRFYGVVIHTKDLNNRTVITASLDKLLDKNRRKPSNNKRYITWINKHVKAGIKCGNTDICQIFYTSKK